MPLVGFSWERSYPEGVVDLELKVVTHPLSRTIMLEFYVVKSTSNYNVLLGRSAMQKLNIGVSTIRSVVEFPTREGIFTVKSNCPGRDIRLAVAVEVTRTREIQWEAIPTEERVVNNLDFLD
ncbi:hypothetical protein Tco_1487938 [Tanacetum coccineum]